MHIIYISKQRKGLIYSKYVSIMSSTMSSTPHKFTYRPNGAYKLLTHILYGQYSHMEVLPRGIIELQSIRRLGRLLGTQSHTINLWLLWLENQGYIESLQYSPGRRSVRFRIRIPTNVIYS